ncbi:MAG: enoyl-CoA hydratase [Betaproteobacteria bacterium]|nr:enoyl-CoA hydratase [Betaproteobacteria bacterium]
MSPQTLIVDESGDGLLQVTLNRPQTRNALNTQMGLELREIFAPLAFHPRQVRCVLITGSGDKAFCAGGDLKERNGMSDEQWRVQHAIFEEAYYAIMNCVVPVIGAVNGSAFGGGCELALACDFIYASSSARFALPETTLGILPGCGGTQNLPRAVGERRAKELILTGRAFTAQEGYEWGMVNRVCEPADLMPAALATARQMCTSAPVSLRQAKTAIRRGLDVDLRTGLAIEVEAYNRTVVTEDRLEGVRAFGEKRKPVFKGK